VSDNLLVYWNVQFVLSVQQWMRLTLSVCVLAAAGGCIDYTFFITQIKYELFY